MRFKGLIMAAALLAGTVVPASLLVSTHAEGLTACQTLMLQLRTAQDKLESDQEALQLVESQSQLFTGFPGAFFTTVNRLGARVQADRQLVQRYQQLVQQNCNSSSSARRF